MTSWTVHVKDGAPVQLVPERFSLGALLLVWSFLFVLYRNKIFFKA